MNACEQSTPIHSLQFDPVLESRQLLSSWHPGVERLLGLAVVQLLKAGRPVGAAVVVLLNAGRLVGAAVIGLLGITVVLLLRSQRLHVWGQMFEKDRCVLHHVEAWHCEMPGRHHVDVMLRVNASLHRLYRSEQAVGWRVGIRVGSRVGNTEGVSELYAVELVGTNVG